jgi:hypothetical protein
VKLTTVHLNGIKLDAYYESYKTKDPLGTGDSPTEIDIDLMEISTPCDSVNIIDILDEHWLEEARQQIVNNEFVGD